ncbi:flagellar protein FlaG [Aeribacillus alveayuensis]|uniref:Flagellar protein FlaG n=1 Tax=Aeribacillus alveayuensis TaxID=279215 RepID=A0ABT9VM36_9BACI|nr:flagellar protein FlaG [Bacillus alveayuensis]
MLVERVSQKSFLYDHDSYPNREHAAANQAQSEQNDSPVPKIELEKAVKKMNEFIKPVETSIQFELHEELNEYYVKVINKETEEVIREIPPKKLLDMYAAMAELIGIIINERV